MRRCINHLLQGYLESLFAREDISPYFDMSAIIGIRLYTGASTGKLVGIDKHQIKEKRMLRMVIFVVALAMFCLICQAAPAFSSNRISHPGDDIGCGSAVTNLDNNYRPDLILVAASQYKVGFNLNADGKATSWSQVHVIPPKNGWILVGAALDVAFIDDNERPDLVYASYDPSDKSIHYIIGWNLSSSGQVASWSDVKTHKVGAKVYGLALAIADVYYDDRPEFCFFMHTNNNANNVIRAVTAYDVKANGDPSYFGNVYTVHNVLDGLGDIGRGLGADFANLDNNPRPELVIGAYKFTANRKTLHYQVGWNWGDAAEPEHWSESIGQGFAQGTPCGASVSFLKLSDKPSQIVPCVFGEAPSLATKNGFQYYLRPTPPKSSVAKELLPDLHVYNLKFAPRPTVSGGRASLKKSTTYAVEVEVQNLGDKRAEGVDVSMTLIDGGGSVIADRGTINSIRAGESGTVTLRLRLRQTGSSKITITADPYDRIKESREGENSNTFKSASFNVN